MTDPLQEHYQALFRTHGNSAHAVQYSDSESQHRRFEILAQAAGDIGSVVDLGCGLGHFCDFLRARGFSGKYLGLDFVREFVDDANARHAGDPLVEFRQFDLRADAYPEGFDTYVVCGVFNNRTPDNQAFLESTLARAFAATRRRVAFNLMSTYVDFQDESLFYTDPRAVFDFCKRRLTSRLTLRNDYLVRDDRPPFEYAVYLYK